MLLEFREIPANSGAAQNCFALLMSRSDYRNARYTMLASTSFGYFNCYFQHQQDNVFNNNNLTVQKVESYAQTENDGGDNILEESSVHELLLQCFRLSSEFAGPLELLVLNSKFSALNKLIEGDMVILKPISKILKAEQVEIAPESYDDWKLIEHSATIIEEIFMDQLRVVRPGMPFVLCLTTGVQCYFRVKSVGPTHQQLSISRIAWLVTDETTVLVVPFSLKNTIEHSIGRNFIKEKQIILASENFFATDLNSKCCSIEQFLLPNEKMLIKRRFRILFQKLNSNNSKKFSSKIGKNSNIVVTINSDIQYVKSWLVEFHRVHCVKSVELDPEDSRIIIYGVWLEVPRIQTEQKYYGAYNEIISYLIKYDRCNPLRLQYCWGSKKLRKVFDECESIQVIPIDKSRLQHVDELIARLTLANGQENKNYNQMELEQKLNSKFCCKFFSIPYAPYIIDRGSKLRFNYQNADGSEVHFDVDLFPKKLDKKSCDSNSIFYIWPRDVRFRVEFCARNDEQIKDVKAGRQRHGIENENRALRNAAHNKICEFEFQTSLLDELECVIYSKLARACEFFSNNRSFILDHILIVGPEFAGKTSLLHFLADRIFRKNAIFSAQINCIEWRGRSTDTILRRLRATFSTLCARAPSVLLLDDFDALNFESVNADEAQIRIKQLIYSKIVAEIQSHIIHCASAVVLICTTQQEINLPTCAKSWEGRRLFSHSFQISSIKKQEQAKILAQLLNALSIKSWTHAFDAHADLTVGELCALANQIRLTKLNDEELHVGTISTALARRSLTQPIDLLCSRDASLQFDVIGGLTNVKQRLIEIFVWPIKYPQLFAKCGITLGARAILYGPSGCGKTILLRALAAECGENFRSIHVRGPELLSKYIGESEANVRSLFARARVARPCILALDEFDALVPSRGHDNTGVTDRVVNQFLTELDGVENCVKSGDDGVFVIAATNRIELIDRALLRPGRFDHNIFVGHPTQLEEFVDILRIHTSDVRLADELDLNVLALKCLDSNETTWNGASLRAWILNAKFYALNELKKCNESQSDQCMNSGKEFISKTSNNDMAARELVLRMQHFDAVFHASLPKKTLAHASADYFTKNGSHNDDQNPKSKQIEKRVTLA